jgi:hypothetical protein
MLERMTFDHVGQVRCIGPGVAMGVPFPSRFCCVKPPENGFRYRIRNTLFEHFAEKGITDGG